jgi:hypothetical protein
MISQLIRGNAVQVRPWERRPTTYTETALNCQDETNETSARYLKLSTHCTTPFGRRLAAPTYAMASANQHESTRLPPSMYQSKKKHRHTCTR